MDSMLHLRSMSRSCSLNSHRQHSSQWGKGPGVYITEKVHDSHTYKNLCMCVIMLHTAGIMLIGGGGYI